MTSQYENEVMFKCAVRGFHCYRKEWHPKPAEKFNCRHEQNSRRTVGQLKSPEQQSFYWIMVLKLLLN